MADAHYRTALETATREYERLLRQQADIEARLAQLRESIGTLTRLCGYTPTVPYGLTDACRTALRCAGRPMTPLEVRDRLAATGFDLSKYANPLAAIHTVLKRLSEGDGITRRRLPRARGASFEYTPSEKGPRR